MTFKSIALAATLLALPLAVTASITGGAALAATVGGGGGTPGTGSDAGGSNTEPSLPVSLCVLASSNTLAEARRHANDGCPKTVTIRIGSLALN
jgi:hypothetical protein